MEFSASAVRAPGASRSRGPTRVPIEILVRPEHGMLRPALKNAMEALLVRSGAPGLARRLRAGQTVVLAYHNVVPGGVEGRGDVSLHLPLPRFTRQLDLLTSTHEVVGLEAVARELSGDAGGGEDRRGPPRAAITFDDAYRGAMKLAVPELVSRGLPATIFVAPALLGDRATWWDRIAPWQERDGRRLRERALGEYGGDERAILEAADRQGWEIGEPGRWHRTATEEELGQAAAEPGITLGAHGWRHLNLRTVPLDVLRHELETPLRWLRERMPSVVPWLAYPYGLASEREERTAREAGYAGAFMAGGGWIPRRTDRPHALPRLNVPSGLSANGLRLRLAGLVPG